MVHSVPPEESPLRFVVVVASLAAGATAVSAVVTGCGDAGDPAASEVSSAETSSAETGPVRAAPPAAAEDFADPVTRRRRDESDAGRLVAAAADDDPARVREFLAAGVSPNARDGHGYGPLHQAAAANATEVLEILLEAGAEVDAADGRGWSALTWAAYLGAYAAVRYLLDAGADPNHRAPPESATALDRLMMAWHLAGDGVPGMPPLREEQRFAIARHLLEAGADPDRPGGIPPLETALFSGRTDLVTLFLDHGARLDSLPNARTRQLFLERSGPIGDLARQAAEREAKVPR